MYKQALQIAYNAHKGQTRRDSSVPYIVHPIRISTCFIDDMRKTISILHDVAEDTDVTLEDLNKHFPDKIIKTLDALTKRKDEKYFSYIKRLSKDEIAIEVKIHDLVDNLSDTLCIQPQSMIDRYEKALKILINK